ncbi:MAG: hypothetical protein ACK4IX_04715, partial [Candidatus Sericytochromatia bacterium]
MYAALKLFSIFLISISFLTSCNIVSSSNIQKVNTGINDKNTFVIDIGKGKTGGNISFKINIHLGERERFDPFNEFPNLPKKYQVFEEIIVYL